MCGISAIFSKTHDIRGMLFRGISTMLSRGYDSVGCLLVNENSLWLSKHASSDQSTCDAISFLQRDLEQLDSTESYNLGMCHLRWSTHGAKTGRNAHPHSSTTSRFWVVHNGIITNYEDIKISLEMKGYRFLSETDTEVVPVLMQDIMTVNQVDVFTAWTMTINKLEGTWALLMLDMDHKNCIYAAKNGSPLLFALSKDEDIIGFASEYSGLDFTVHKYTTMNDGDILRSSLNNGAWEIVKYQLEDINWCFETKEQYCITSPHPYLFWTEKEIYQQPDKLWDAINCGGRLFKTKSGWKVKLGGLDKISSQLSEVEHLIIIGCGSSLHAAMLTAHLFRQISGMTTVQVFDASECNVEDIALKKSALIVLSQSGETADCQLVLNMVKDCITIGVVNVVGSMISKNTDCGIYLNAGKEFGVAATKSFTSQCIVLSLLAMWFAQNKGNNIQRHAPIIHSMSSQFSNNLPDIEKYVQQIMPMIINQEHAYILGKGYGFAVALEAALKMKELTYIHVEAFAGSTMKHGSFALIDSEKQPVVFINAFKGNHFNHMMSAAKQVECRGARVVFITNDENAKSNPSCVIHANDEFTAALISILFFQILSYRISVGKNINPDFPRNLAKTVTVS